MLLLAGHAARPALAPPWPDADAGRVLARYAGNCLSELDRLLHVLMDALATEPDRVRPRRSNTANRIADVAGWDLGTDGVRLRALGRSRACLSYCGGIARRADAPGTPWMTVGWCDPSDPARLRRYRLGERVMPDGADLAAVGLFYGVLAGRLVSGR